MVRLGFWVPIASISSFAPDWLLTIAASWWFSCQFWQSHLYTAVECLGHPLVNYMFFHLNTRCISSKFSDAGCLRLKRRGRKQRNLISYVFSRFPQHYTQLGAHRKLCKELSHVRLEIAISWIKIRPICAPDLHDSGWKHHQDRLPQVLHVP